MSAATASAVEEIIQQVWDSFLGDGLSITGTVPNPGPPAVQTSGHVQASVSVVGAWNGFVTITADLDAARNIAGAMFAMAAEDVQDAEISDAVGELVNIVGGNLKAIVTEPSQISLPQVVVDARSVVTPAAREDSRTTLEWNGAKISVSVWEAEQKA
jgi:chemotaxis protein CheX